LPAAPQHPWIDRQDCLVRVAQGQFGRHSGRALQLHQQGFCLLRPRDPHWLPLLDQVRSQVQPLVDLSEWRSGAAPPLPLSDAWRNPATPAVRELALHPEVLELLHSCYGREPCAVHTLNLPVGSHEALHRDASAFQSEPAGFVVGVWVALEDVHPDAGPLRYCPGSHRLPCVSGAAMGSDSHWQQQIEEHGLSLQPFAAQRGDVLIWHANLVHGGSPVVDHQRTCWSQVHRYLFAGCRFTKPSQAFSDGRVRPRRRPRASGRPAESAALDLTGTPLIDRDDCQALVDRGHFGPHGQLAETLHSQGFGHLHISDPHWPALLSSVRRDLEPLVDLQALAKGTLGPLRFQDAWLHQGLASVRTLACHPEILSALRVLYGRNPFPFQTLNFPNGTAQHFHSDAVHFHSLPPGFMCGVWVALEDVHAQSGPLVYFPGSHRLPYQSARDLGLSQADVLAEKAPQRFFEAGWRDAVQQEGFERRLFLAQRGDVLIWHANLLHGGAPVQNKRLSRWSQVSHYYFQGCAYTTPLLQATDAAPDGPQWRLHPLDLTRA
jgi:ectoine hydroxylase-related dioxygenase (phytanoyl-CoA dioxygenase family)